MTTHLKLIFFERSPVSVCAPLSANGKPDRKTKIKRAPLYIESLQSFSYRLLADGALSGVVVHSYSGEIGAL